MTTIHPGGVPGGLSRSDSRPGPRPHSGPDFDARVAVHRVPVLAAVVVCIAALYWWGWGAGVASAIRDLTGNAGPRQPGVITVRGQWLRIADDLALTAVAAAAFLVVRRLAEWGVGWGADSRQSDGAAAGAVVASVDVAAADTSAGGCADHDGAVVAAGAVDVADLPRPRPRSLDCTHARARVRLPVPARARLRVRVPARARLRAWWDAGFAYCWCMLAGFAAIDVASALIRTTFYAYPFATRFENGWAAALYLVGMFLAGPTEELVLLALPVVGLRHAGMPWWAVTCVAVALRVPFHLYYGWAAFAIGVWPVLAVMLFRRVGMITPMIVAHGMYDVSTAMTSLTGVAGSLWPVALAAAIMATPVVWAVVRIVVAVRAMRTMRAMRAARGADASHTRT